MIWTGIRRGDSHHNYCEDSLFVQEYSSIVVGGVFDGCSSGHRSHVASGMLAYAFKKAFDSWFVDIYDYLGFIDLMSESNFVKPIKDGIKNFKAAVAALNLGTLEVLSTAIVFIYHPYERKLVIITLGDGFYSVNHESYVELTSNNTPDYVGYHLLDNLDTLNDYIKSNIIILSDVANFSICSDGITAVRPVDHADINVIDYLLTDLSLSHSKAMLTRKFNILSKAHAYDDDLSIIRYESI